MLAAIGFVIISLLYAASDLRFDIALLVAYLVALTGISTMYLPVNQSNATNA